MTSPGLITTEHLREIRRHLESAIGHLPTDEEVDRLVNPRHTDLDNRAYLPTKVSRDFAAAREALVAAIEELEDAASGRRNE